MISTISLGIWGYSEIFILFTEISIVKKNVFEEGLILFPCIRTSFTESDIFGLSHI